jgi:hypothetical protein
LTSCFILSSEMTSGLKSTSAERPGNETEAEFTPAKEQSFFSTLAEHAEHAMPTTGIVFFIGK